MTAIGIDFGTTNSVAARYASGSVEVIPIGTPPADWAAMGFDQVLPSVVALDDLRTMKFGWDAKLLSTDVKFEAIKRLFKAEEVISAGGEDFLVEEIASALFAHIRKCVLANGIDFTAAVITVPANSRGLARYRTKVCAGIGEIEPLALINEPTAAAMAYSKRQVGAEQNVLVFDFGGGTLDVTLLDTRDDTFFEQASSGVGRLGGLDFDNAIMRDLVEHVAGAESWSTEQKNRVKIEVEKAKILLSTQDEYTIVVEGLIPSGFRVTRPRFNELTRSLVERSGTAVQRVLSDMRMGPGDVDVLLLVGGSSKVPAVRQFVSELVGREPAPGVDPLTAIGEGAAIAAAILTGEETESDFVVSTEHSLGTVVVDPRAAELQFSPIIRRNQKLPARQTETFYPVFDDQESVRVVVVEGDDSEPLDHPDNVVLTEFVVPIDPPRAVSEAGFDLTYTYDTDGLLHVDVVDAMTAATITERVTVAFKGARDPRELVSMAGRVRDAVDGGDVAGSVGASTTLDPRTQELVSRARSKVIPFVDDAEAAAIQGLVDRVIEATADEVVEAQGELETELRKYTFLW